MQYASTPGLYFYTILLFLKIAIAVSELKVQKNAAILEVLPWVQLILFCLRGFIINRDPPS